VASGGCVGVDLGALWTKAVAMGGGKVLASGAVRSTMKPEGPVKELVGRLLSEAGLLADGAAVAATGVGRKHIASKAQLTDLMAFSKAAIFLHPAARLVADLGGQGVRLMEMEPDGTMAGFTTNDKCSTGTGCFLDIMAAALGVEPAYMGTAMAGEPAVINTSCTVFAESEVVTLVAKKRPKEEIIAGLNEMVAKKVVAMINAVSTKGDIVLGGGVAMNAGVAKAIELGLKRKVVLPPQPNMLGAIGAALTVGGRA
jgi:predicted CoA-substrate-specific enzyme activase